MSFICNSQTTFLLFVVCKYPHLSSIPILFLVVMHTTEAQYFILRITGKGWTKTDFLNRRYKTFEVMK